MLEEGLGGPVEERTTGPGIAPLDHDVLGLEAQTGRRSIKTPLPLDGIPYYDTAKYIYVGRDGRDVFMSFWNHHNNYSDMMKGMCTEKAQAMGKDFKV